MKICGCRPNALATAVVPHFGAPIRKKLGLGMKKSRKTKVKRCQLAAENSRPGSVTGGGVFPAFRTVIVLKVRQLLRLLPFHFDP